MKVCTKFNEIVEVDEKKIVEFPEGLLGFENVKKFAIIDSEYEPFIWLAGGYRIGACTDVPIEKGK